MERSKADESTTNLDKCTSDVADVICTLSGKPIRIRV